MFEYISAKVAVMAAAFLLLASTLGIFSVLNTQARDAECQSVADEIGQAINSMQSLNGAAKRIMSFDDSGDGLPSRLGDASYVLHIRPGSVLLIRNGQRYSATFFSQVHPWMPEGPVNASVMEGNDAANTFLEIRAGTSFVIERREVDMDSGKVFATFIYPEHEG